MENIITTFFKRPDKAVTTLQVDVNLMAGYFDYTMMERITDALAQKAVDEIWKIHGASIIKKLDKKTIGNISVKKLSALIAKELATQPSSTPPKSINGDKS